MIRPAALVLAVLAAVPASAGGLAAQCPNGAPPPCARAEPLDENRWIVVPFQNIARAPDAEWLAVASVNLLYLNLSRWQDLRVVDDERVADLLRPRGGSPLGLSEAMVLARRVRAGKVVMGDLLKVGTTLTVVGKVYRVATGQRLRQVTVEVPSPDSVFASYRRLAALLLELPSADGGGSVGTASLDAYREYVRGVTALRRWELDSARAALRRAIAQDSGFALAHYQLARTLGWLNSSDSTRVLEGMAALRLGGGLPPRERALVAANVDFEMSRYEPARAAYRSLIARDSGDAEAWYGLGETEYHDYTIRTDGGTPRFAGSWNSALAAFERVVTLDPSFHLAYGHIDDIRRARERLGCERADGSPVCGARYGAAIRLEADTLVMRPRPDSTDDETLLADVVAAARSGLADFSRRAMRESAARWVQSGPQEPDAHLAFAQALLRLGDADGAARELASITAPPRRADARTLQRMRVEIAVRRQRYAEARAIADTLFVLPLTREGDPANGVYALLGQFRRWDQRLAPTWPAEFTTAFGATLRTVAGAPPANLAEAEEGYLRLRTSNEPAFRADRPLDRLGSLLMTIAFGLRFRSRAGLPADTTSRATAFMRVTSARVLSDTAAMRRFAAAESAADFDDMPMEAVLVQLAETWLELGDSSAARAALARLETDVFPTAELDGGDYGNFSGLPGIWGRAFLLQGDLAAAHGDREVAVRAYRRVVGLWSTGDPELQPGVSRARAALAAAGVSP